MNINPLYRTSELHYALEKVGILYLIKLIVTPLNSDWQIFEHKIEIILFISFNMGFTSATIKLSNATLMLSRLVMFWKL